MFFVEKKYSDTIGMGTSDLDALDRGNWGPRFCKSFDVQGVIFTPWRTNSLKVSR